jgi:hypothetical protein
MPCKLTPIPDSPDFEGSIGASVTIITTEHIGAVLMLKAEYAGEQLVPPNQAVTEVSFTVKRDRHSLKLVCVFSASIKGVGELRESAPPDSQLLRPLNGDEPFQLIRIIGT